MTPLEILTAIFNTFWQAAALAGLVSIALTRVRINAATRCVIWWAMLAVLLVLPIAPGVMALLSQPRAASAIADRVHVAPAPDSLLPPSEVDGPRAIVTLPEKPSARWPMAIFALWAVMLLYRLTRIAQSYLHLRRVKRESMMSDLPLPEVGRRIRLLISHDIASPMAVGFRHAAVILPEDLAGRITPDELNQILLHETAHLARRDDWSNLLGRLLGSVLALHPVAWWILRRIEYEREAACDDWVVARTGAVRPYAEALAHMVELRWQPRGSRHTEEALASGVFGRGSRIGERIEMLLETGRQFSSRVSLRRVAAGTCALCCLAAAGSFAPRWIAFAKIPVPENVSAATQVPAAPVVQRQFEPQSALIAQAIPNIPKISAPTPAPAFEAASVKATAGTTPSDWISPRVEDSQRFRARTIVEKLIEWAYGVREFQILGAPEWLKREQFDIQATAGRPSGEDQFRQMLQALLADRFRLKLHREIREIPVYLLVVGKNGPRLNESEGVHYCCGGEINIGRGDFIARGATMPLFVRILTDNLDRPVLDKTELPGHYDFDMTFEPAEGPAWSPIGAQLFALVQDLGLRLEPQKASVEMLDIDAAERPSEN